MRKIFSFWVVLLGICCLSTSIMAKTVTVQEYKLKLMGIKPEKPCPAPYYFTGENRPENAECTQHTKRKECYKCYCSTKYFPYTAQDCGELKPGGKSCTMPKSVTRYETCDCPTGFYKKEELTSTSPADDAIIKYTSITNKSGKTITCWQPQKCKKGKEIKEDELIVNKQDNTATSDDSCTILKIVSALKKDNATYNIWCAKDYDCKGGCSKNKGAAECAIVSTDDTLKNYYKDGCEYYSRCSTAAPCVSSATATSTVNIEETASLYTPSGSSPGKCYKAVCKTDVLPTKIYGEEGLSINGESTGIKVSTEQYGGVACAIYSCSEGWINAKAEIREGQVVDVAAELENLQEGGKYKAAFVQNHKGGFFACRIQEESEQKSGSECFVECTIGDLFDTESKTCVKEGDISDIYIGKDEQGWARVLPMDITPSEDKKLYEYSEAQEKMSKSVLSLEEFESIKEKVFQTYGAKCYVLKDAIVSLKEEIVLDQGPKLSVVPITNEADYIRECPGMAETKLLVSLKQTTTPLKGTDLTYKSSILTSEPFGYAVLQLTESQDSELTKFSGGGSFDPVCTDEALIEGCIELSENGTDCEICANGYLKYNTGYKVVCAKCEYSDDGLFDQRTLCVDVVTGGEIIQGAMKSGCLIPPEKLSWTGNRCYHFDGNKGAKQGCYYKERTINAQKKYEGFPCMTGCKECSEDACSVCEEGYTLFYGRCSKRNCANAEMQNNYDKNGGVCACDENHVLDETIGCCIVQVPNKEDDDAKKDIGFFEKINIVPCI